jgi:hypothetical protein
MVLTRFAFYWGFVSNIWEWGVESHVTGFYFQFFCLAFNGKGTMYIVVGIIIHISMNILTIPKLRSGRIFNIWGARGNRQGLQSAINWWRDLSASKSEFLGGEI